MVSLFDSQVIIVVNSVQYNVVHTYCMGAARPLLKHAWLRA